MAFAWTKERVEKLTQMWNGGYSGSQCAAELGVTRNAAIGKVRRLGLMGGRSNRPAYYNKPGRKPDRRTGPRVKRPKQRADIVHDLATAPLPPPKAEDVARVALLDLEHHHCRWPAGDPVQGFCGCPKVPGLPCCEGHAVRAFRVPVPRRPAAEPIRSSVFVAS